MCLAEVKKPCGFTGLTQEDGKHIQDVGEIFAFSHLNILTPYVLVEISVILWLAKHVPFIKRCGINNHRIVGCQSKRKVKSE